MKTLYLIGGTMGIGKTTTCQLLKSRLNQAVFLDGDWCWDASPFQVTEETKVMVMSNICFLLNNFIHCSAYQNIIFCWVMHEQSIIDHILSRIDTSNCKVKCISLVTDAESLRRRIEADIDRTDRMAERSIARLPLYELLNTIKIDVSQINAEQAAEEIQKL